MFFIMRQEWSHKNLYSELKGDVEAKCIELVHIQVCDKNSQ